jgi:Protein of unknown function (DUF2917)
MREISTSIVFEIKPGETVPLRIAHSVRLCVNGGPVWATRSDDTEDYWLAPGDHLKLRKRERLWLSVEGDRPAQVAFTLAPRHDQRALNWAAQRLERLIDRFRHNWRTI